MIIAQNRRLIFSCFAGNFLEWFEFAAFGFLIQPISSQFFPKGNAIIAYLLTYGLFATGFLMRPFGGILCGYLGDRYGRKKGLMASISLMAVPTFLIGILPTYDQIGITAPILLLLCRMTQGISLGGEFSGSIVYLIEHAPAKKEGLFGSFADMGSSVGMICATLLTMFLTHTLTIESLSTWGWRIPFLFGIIFGYIGYIIRRRLLESPAYLQAQTQTNEKKINPLKESFQRSPLIFMLSITFLAINAFGYYFLIIYLPHHNGLTVSPLITFLQPLICLLVMMPATFFGAILSDRIGSAPILSVGSISAILLAFPLMKATIEGPLSWQFVYQILFSIILGLCFGPRSRFIVGLFPAHIRFTGVSITYNLSNALFGGTAPMLCSAFVIWLASPFAPAYVLCFMAATSLVSVMWLKAQGADRAFSTNLLNKGHNKNLTEYNYLKKE